MTPAWWGAVLGATAAAGVVLIVLRVVALRRPGLAHRVLPYLRDLPTAAAVSLPRRVSEPSGDLAALAAPALRWAADGVERVLGGAASIRRRLDRAGLDVTVHEFRVQQVLWGLLGFAAAAAYCLARALAGTGGVVFPVLVCSAAFVVGVLARDSRLSSQVSTRERRILAEFPTVAELLALSVAAGEGPVSALSRVVARSGGDLSVELGAVLARIRTGEPVGLAFDGLAARTGVPLVARFAQGIAVAVERGTPLADVLHAQAADVRDAGRRELIELAARREVVMMVPVVFLVLPVTVLFAFWPGVVGLSLVAP